MLDFNDLEHLALKVLVEKAEDTEDTAGTECGNMGEKMIVSKIRKKTFYVRLQPLKS